MVRSAKEAYERVGNDGRSDRFAALARATKITKRKGRRGGLYFPCPEGIDIPGRTPDQSFTEYIY